MSDPIEALGAPATEFSEPFVQGMRQRMAVSFHKYGYVTETRGVVDHVAGLRRRLERYEETGNTEWLMDVANMSMIEWMIPSHPDAHFRATDSDESPGRELRPKTNVMGTIVPQRATALPNRELD